MDVERPNELYAFREARPRIARPRGRGRSLQRTDVLADPRFRIAAAQQIGNDRHRAGSGGDHLGRPVERDPADGDDRLAPPGRTLAPARARGRCSRCPWWRCRRPARRRGSRPPVRSASSTCCGSCVDTPMTPSPNTSRTGVRRQVVLSDMDAGRSRHPGDVGAVVDDHRGAERPGGGDDLRGEIEKARGRAALDAQLHDARAAVKAARAPASAARGRDRGRRRRRRSDKGAQRACRTTTRPRRDPCRWPSSRSDTAP